MKKILIPIVLLFSITLLAQDDGVKLDLLKAPSSPASNLLGISASDVDKPTDVSAFMLSLQKATSNFTALPSNYAIDIAPYWLCKKKMGDITTKGGLNDTAFVDNFKQTFVLSLAMRNTDENEKDLIPNTAYAGLGFKFSICRGTYDASTIKSLKEIHDLQVKVVNANGLKLDDYKNDLDVLKLQNQRKKDVVKKGVLEKRKENMIDTAKIKEILTEISELDTDIQNIGDELGAKLEELKKGTEVEAKASIKVLAASFQTARIGFTWDFAGGISANFIDKRFDNSKVNNAGIWTTLGYTSENYGSILFIARLLNNPDKIFAKDDAPNDMKNISTLDFGGRYIFAGSQSKFSTSLEGIYRSVLSSNTIKPSWKLIFNADYAIWQNQKITFSFGRNFDGTITKDGNLIAALTFLTGFGNKR